MAISPDLLDALLSPDRFVRSRAEESLNSIANPCQEWIRVIPHLSHQHHVQLACVLLRRSLMKLTNVQELLALVDPLIQIISEKPVANALAEIPAVIDLFDGEQAKQSCQRILSQVHSPVRSSDVKKGPQRSTVL